MNISTVHQPSYLQHFFVLVFFFALTAGITVSTIRAAEILLRNDTIPAGGSNSPVLGFITGEQAASWLTVPNTGDVVGVQVQWDSIVGTNTNILERFVNIYAGGTFPTPGPLLAQINLPPLSDGLANEMRHLDPPTNSQPIQIPVVAGQTIVVALEFLNATNPGNIFHSSVDADADGIQAAKNSIFTLPGNWSDAMFAGVLGNFGLRAILQPGPLLGDFNEDDVVDESDYILWLSALGGPESAIGNLGDGSGTVDEADYLLWTTNFGLSVRGTVSPLAAVPEPAGALLLLLGVTCSLAFIRRPVDLNTCQKDASELIKRLSGFNN